jgi:hypothetical protein
MDTAMPYMTIIKESMKMLERKYSETISDIHNVEGFSKLENVLLIKSGSVFVLDNLINYWIKTDTFKQFDDFAKKIIHDAFDELMMEAFSRPYMVHKFDLCYLKDTGTMNIFHMRILKAHDETYHYDVCLIKTDFKPSQPYVVITTSESDLFSSETVQHIEYMPANFKNEHFGSIIKLNRDVINAFF